MLYSIAMGNVAGASQSAIVHLMTTVEAVGAAGIQYVFTDGHATMAVSAFFGDPRHLDQIDWPLMQAQYWNDTQAEPDRKRRRQAEFLVYQFLPWKLIAYVGVRSEPVKAQVDAVLQAHGGHHPPVAVRPEWYY